MPEGHASEGLVQQVSSNILNILSNFKMNGHDNLVLGLAGGRGHNGGTTSSRIKGFGGFTPIPDRLELKT